MAAKCVTLTHSTGTQLWIKVKCSNGQIAHSACSCIPLSHKTLPLGCLGKAALLLSDVRPHEKKKKKFTMKTTARLPAIKRLETLVATKTLWPSTKLPGTSSQRIGWWRHSLKEWVSMHRYYSRTHVKCAHFQSHHNMENLRGKCENLKKRKRKQRKQDEK